MADMESGDFRRVLTNGLGRAVLWLQDHSWQPHEDAIRQVCLHNTAYDAQCEGSRAAYVYEIVKLTGDTGHFAKISACGLLEAREYWDVDHLFSLNQLFAKAGNENARQALYEKFRQDDATEHFVGADEIIKLDRLEGLLFVLERIGAWVETHPEYWVDSWLLRGAQEDLGVEVMAAVREAAENNQSIRSYLEAVGKHERERKTGHQQRSDFRKFTYAEMRDRMRAAHGNVPRGWLSGWGKHTLDESIRLAAADLLNEHDDQLLVAYLRLFSLRPFPLDHQRLVELAASANADVATASRRALRHLQSKAVRTLALDLLRQGTANSDVLRLLVKNYGRDDHMLIESMLDRQQSEDDFHWTAHAVVHVFEANPQASALTSLVKVYENCRCSICRSGAVKIMVDRHIIPPGILKECKYDSYEDTRRIASAAA